ncbi:MAG: 50S ribosomal protein L21, partial [Minisyncoccales bacterium]
MTDKLAVLEIGGKQYLIKEGENFKTEKIKGREGQEVIFDKVLLLADEKGVKIGAPFLKGSFVKAQIIKQGREKKIIILKFRRKTRYKVKKGHRQFYSRLK